MSDKRRRIRVKLDNLALAKGERVTFDGRLEDISANGALMVFSSPQSSDQQGFKSGDSIELHVDGMSSLSGWVVRATDEDVAIEFTHDNVSEENLIAKLMKRI